VRAREVRKPSKPEKALAVAFEYRCLTEARGKEHGTAGQQKLRESLDEDADKRILDMVA
jgi:hypothetical protein